MKFFVMPLLAAIPAKFDMQRGKAMKRYFLPILAILLLSSLLLGCASDDKDRPITSQAVTNVGSETQQIVPTTEASMDSPVFLSDEVCALVYEYLLNKVMAIADMTQRGVTYNVLVDSKPYFVAEYQSKNKWVIYGLGIRDTNWTYNGGSWFLYETSRMTEPANEQAVNLINYIQRYTMSVMTTIPPTQVPTATMPSRTARIGGKQYPEVYSRPVSSSNWVVSYFSLNGELPQVPNALIPLFINVDSGGKLPLTTTISVPSSQFWVSLLPSEQQKMLDIVEWYGMPAEDYLWLIRSLAPGSR